MRAKTKERQKSRLPTSGATRASRECTYIYIRAGCVTTRTNEGKKSEGKEEEEVKKTHIFALSFFFFGGGDALENAMFLAPASFPARPFAWQTT